MLAAIPDDSTVAFRGLDARISTDHIQGYFNVATRGRRRGDRAPPAADQRWPGSCAGDVAAGGELPGRVPRVVRQARLPPPARRRRDRQMKDVAMGTSPAPANATEAIRDVVVMLLMSPRFVNHLELAGTPISGRGDYLALDPYEIASRLSYTFWQTMPDDALLAAAADGSLATDAGFATQLDRVFADPRTRDTHLAVLERVDAASNRSPASRPSRPAFKALAAGENLGVAGHDH